MTHEVEITTTENRIIEEYWVIEARENERSSVHNPITGRITVYVRDYPLKERKEINHAPSHQEIAQFLSESKADFVSVEHNYRFADLPFC